MAEPLNVSHTRLLLGDWNRVLRDPIDVLRLTFPIGAAAVYLSGDLDGALGLLAAFALLVVARFLNLPRPFDLGFTVGLAFSAWGGTLDLFETFPWWDELLHFFIPMFAAPLLYLGFVRLDVLPDLEGDSAPRHRYAGIFLATFALGLAFGAVWEVYEWCANHLLSASLIIGYGDTIADLVEDATGSLAGGGLLILWAERGWGTLRRLPGEKVRGREAAAGGSRHAS